MPRFSFQQQKRIHLLHEAVSTHHTRVDELLLAALVHTCARWLGVGRLVVDLESHGREEALLEQINLARTIGWFTSLYPVCFTLDPKQGYTDVLKHVKHQQRQIHHHGLDYGVLRYLRQDAQLATELKAVPQADISFNYLGQFNQEVSETALFTLTQEPTGAPRSPRNGRSHFIEINALVADGKLHMLWNYSSNFFERTTVMKLSEQCNTTLRDFLRQSDTSSSQAYVPSDFPMANINQETLDQIMNKLQRTQGES